MAIDPNQLSTEQMQRSAMDAAGAPTEFAGAPEQLTRVAQGGAFKELLQKLGRSVIGEVPPAAAPSGAGMADPRFAPAVGPTIGAGVVQRIPTPQERRLFADMGDFSERAAQEALAPQVLSPEGVRRFQERGMQAPGVNAPPAPVAPDVLQSATDALNQQAAEAAEGANAIRTDAQKALTADARGFRAETAVAPEEITDPILDALSKRDLEIKSLQDGGDFNFDYMNTTDDVKATITAVAETLKDQQLAVTRGVISNKTTIEDAAKLAADEIGLSRTLLARKVGEGSLNAAEMVAARDLLVRSATKLATMAESIKTGAATSTDRLAFRRQLAIHAGIQLQLKGAQTEAARALQSFRIPVSGELNAQRLSEEAKNFLRDSGTDDATDALAERILSFGKLPEGEKLKAINDMSQRGFLARTSDVVSELYLAGLLSSPRTQAKNIIGTMGFMAAQLPEEMLAGAWGAAIRKVKGKNTPYNLREDQVYMADAMYRVRGWLESASDAFKIAGKAFRTEIPTDQMNKLEYSVGAIRWTGENSGTLYARAIDNFGKMTRIGFRALLAGDEFFKTISQRGELYVSAHRRYQAGLRAGEDPQKALDEAGMVLLDPRAVSEDLIYKARYDTMTLDAGVLGKLASQFQQIPFLGRIVVPFSTAPTNEILRVLERLPIPGRIQVYKDMLGYNGPKAQQLALGRWSVAGMTMGVVANMALEGRITSSTPFDAKERQALPPGWQPYSFVFRGKDFPVDQDGDFLPLYDEYGRPNGPLDYVNYSGFGVYASIIGLGASIPDAWKAANDITKAQTMAGAMIGSVAEYYKELPMLEGISQLYDAFSYQDPMRILKSPAYAATPAGVPSPVSSLQRSIETTLDPTRVEPRDDVEYYTMVDVETAHAAGDPNFTDRDGNPRYDVIGLPKADSGRMMLEAFTTLRAFQQQDSRFADERDLNAIQYDTLGNAIGAEDTSFWARPGLALWNLTSGMTIKPGRELNVVESELMRLAEDASGWPLNNPETVGGIKLSNGAKSDWVRIAKNETPLNLHGRGVAYFRESLEQLIFTREYTAASDDQKKLMVKRLNRAFMDAGLEKLLSEPQYANLAQAYRDLQDRKAQEENQE